MPEEDQTKYNSDYVRDNCRKYCPEAVVSSISYYT